MRKLYTLLFYALLPVIWLRLLWKSRHAPSLRQRWRERLGYLPNNFADSNKSSIWIHAVSLGEAVVAMTLANALLEKYTNISILITTTTATGAEYIAKHLKKTLRHAYLPYDLPGAVKRFLKTIRPQLLIIIETEIWPNLLHFTHQQKIPMILANARLSEKSFRHYQFLKKLMTTLLSYFSAIITQSEHDQMRFLQLGAAAEKVYVAGNIKFDLQLPEDLAQRALALQTSLGKRPIWIAASTHEGEEVIILEVFLRLRNIYPNLLLILVPRHPQRFEKIYYLCEKTGLKIGKYSQPLSINQAMDILLGDTMGELLLFYAVSDVVFVGGSLVPVGGHNFIEPAALKKSLVSGPFFHNFSQIAQLLVQANGLQIIKNTNNNEALFQIVKNLLNNLSLQEKMGTAALAVSQQHKGALEQHLKIINQFYPRD